MTRRVLISAAGAGTAFCLFTRLRATWGEKIHLFSADINPAHLVTASVLAERHFQVPIARDPEFLPSLRSLIEAESIDTYIPLLNPEIRQATELAPVLTQCDIWASNLSGTLSGSKRSANKWLEGLGISVPQSLNKSEIDTEQHYFAKPDDGSGSHGAQLVTGKEALEIDTDIFLIQPVCVGPEITVDSFFDATTGRARAIARERIEVKSGVCTKARVYEDSTLSEIAKCIGQGLQQRGTICFQVMQLNGEYVVTDLNFRPGAGTALTVATGIDLVSAAFACRWGEEYECLLENTLPPQGAYVTRQYAEFVMPQGPL